MTIKKIIALATSVTLALSILVSCGEKNDSSSTDETLSSIQSESEKTPETDEEWNKAMINKALFSYGNTTKMQEKIQKAKNGDDVTIAYLGGSITEGLTAGNDKCYAKLTYEHFCETFALSENVKYCNAGLSGTPSRLGVIRLQRDVLHYNPDICFVEFAVNDANNAEHQSSYERIIRELIENDVAVILLFSVTEEDYTAQDYMKTLGEYYQLPMISYADALRYMFENNKMTWQDFSDDQSHPNIDGHKMVADMINNYFDTVESQPAQEYIYPEQSFYDISTTVNNLYENTNLNPESIGSWQKGTDVNKFTDGWSFVPQENNEPLTFKFKAKFVYLIYKEVKQGKNGNCHIKITCNGELYDEIDLDPKSPSGWGNPQLLNIRMQPTEVEYEIEISMSEGSEENYMQILGFGT